MLTVQRTLRKTAEPGTRERSDQSLIFNDDCTVSLPVYALWQLSEEAKHFGLLNINRPDYLLSLRGYRI